MSENRRFKVILLAGHVDRPGPGSYAVDLVRGLCNEGHEVFLIARAFPPPEVFSGLEVPVRLFRQLRAWGLGGAMRKWLMRELRAFGPDLLHVATPRLGPIGRKIAQRLEIPSVVTVHGGAVGEKELTARHLRGASVVAASQAVRQDLVNQLRIPKSHITVIYPGVKVRPGPLAVPGGDGQSTVIGTLGMLDYVEGQRFLLAGARKVLDRGLDVQVLVAGSGPEKADLRDRAAQLELGENVTFTEDISRPRELIEIMNIFVLPTMRDGMMPVVLEAMGLGKPVVVSGAGGIFAAVQDNHTGLVFPKGDPDALAAAVVRLMLKPDFTARIAREGRELVRQEFSLDRMLEKTLQLYGRIVEYHAPVAEAE